MAMVNNVPDDWTFSAFSLGRDRWPTSPLAGARGRAVFVWGLEDNLWLGKGQLATNAQLVERAVNNCSEHGRTDHDRADVRTKLNLTRSDPAMKSASGPFAALVVLTACASVQRDKSVALEAVAQLDLDRYLGKWYEIARLSQSGSRAQAALRFTAEYALREDGRLQ